MHCRLNHLAIDLNRENHGWTLAHGHPEKQRSHKGHGEEEEVTELHDTALIWKRAAFSFPCLPLQERARPRSDDLRSKYRASAGEAPR